jgi:5-methylcytosine-specific restriction endonuclease McrA
VVGYLDVDDAWLIALTRQRRRERAAAQEKPHPIRFSAAEPTSEFVVVCCMPANGRRREASKAWRVGQWHAGNRNCTYCGVKTVKATKDGVVTPLTCTVDHKEPITLGGDDAAWNWAICCWACNNRKGALTEAEFRGLLALEASPPAWVDGGRLTA